MSTGAECAVVEPKPGKWYYILETGATPRGYDWRDYATAFGPFPTMDAALNDLDRYHANPGGFWTEPYDPARPVEQWVLDMVAKARRSGGTW